jgi:hypothetical protein
LKEEKGWGFDRVFGVGIADRHSREMAFGNIHFISTISSQEFG